jgi:hypothetical protein
MRLLSFSVLFASLAIAAVAQGNFPARAAGSSRFALQRSHSPAASLVFGRESRGSRRGSSPRAALPFPFFGDAFNSDGLNMQDLFPGGSPQNGSPDASQAPSMLLQALGAMNVNGSVGAMRPPEVDHAPSSNQPLMIELQGGRYVRVTGAAIDGEALPLNLASQKLGAKDSRSSKSAGNPPKRPQAIAQLSTHDLAPVVLIFRDGRSLQVGDYTIADGMLYARGDFYRDGYWNKKIDLSTLDLAKTIQSNTDRSVKFVLPSSPNEVITRP